MIEPIDYAFSVESAQTQRMTQNREQKIFKNKQNPNKIRH